MKNATLPGDASQIETVESLSALSVVSNSVHCSAYPEEAEISFFSLHNGAGQTTTTLADFLKKTKDKKWEELVLAVRSAGAGLSGKAKKDAERDAKGELPCAMLSGRFVGGITAAHLAEHSGFIQIDLDEIEKAGLDRAAIRKKLEECVHVLAVWDSPRFGVKGIWRCQVPAGKTPSELAYWHRNILFPAFEKEIEKLVGKAPDTATKNVNRLCYVSSDPHLHFNAECIAWELPEQPVETEDLPVVTTPDAERKPLTRQPRAKKNRDSSKIVRPAVVEVMLDSIEPRPEYEVWLSICAAVRNSLGDTAKAVELLSAWSPEETPGEYLEKLQSGDFEEIGFGTLSHHAKESGYRGAVKRFFYEGRSNYGMKGRCGFISLSETAVRQHLIELKIPKDYATSILCDIREEQQVDYIGPMAGYEAGERSFNGSRFLVTKSPNLIEPKEGEYPFINKALRDLFHDPRHPEQLDRFLDWASHCYKAVATHKRQQTPALALVGKAGGGKSFVIELLKLLLGGRARSGYAYMAGETKFNGEMMHAELLTIDDDAISKDHRARARLSQSIKSNLFAGAMSIEGKNKWAFDADPIHAFVMAVNDDPEELRVLPELLESMRDKIILMKCDKAVLLDSMEANQAMLKKELPAFVHMVKNRDLSKAYASSNRIKCFWNPEILAAVGALAPERQLLALALECNVVHNAIAAEGKWEGTANELESALTELNSSSSHAARRILYWPGACGTHLGRLSTKHKDSGVRALGVNDKKIRLYRIEVPEDSAPF